MSTERGRARIENAIAAAAAKRRAQSAARTEKPCSRCKRLLPLAQFVTGKPGGDGTHSICRECSAQIQAELRRDRHEAAVRDWAAQGQLPSRLQCPLCPGCGKRRPRDAFRDHPDGRPKGRCAGCRARGSSNPAARAASDQTIARLDREASDIRAVLSELIEQQHAARRDQQDARRADVAGKVHGLLRSHGHVAVRDDDADEVLDVLIGDEQAGVEYVCFGCPSTAGGGESVVHKDGCQAVIWRSELLAEAAAERVHAELLMTRLADLDKRALAIRAAVASGALPPHQRNKVAS